MGPQDYQPAVTLILIVALVCRTLRQIWWPGPPLRVPGYISAAVLAIMAAIVLGLYCYWVL